MEKEPYLEGKPALQSTWPDAAQQLGTGTMGGKRGDMSIILTALRTGPEPMWLTCLTWRHRSDWPS